MLPGISQLRAAASSILSFIQAGVGAIVQTVTEKITRTIHVGDYGRNTVKGVTDCSAALNAAIDHAALLYALYGDIITVDGNGEVYYCATAYPGGTITWPGDSTTSPFCIKHKSGVRLANMHIKGPFTLRDDVADIAVTSLVGIYHPTDGGVYEFYNVVISKFFVLRFHDGVATGQARDLTSSGNAFPSIGPKSERFSWDHVDIGGGGAGLTFGGWYNAGADATSSWVDKTRFNEVNYIRFALGWTAYEEALDAFFLLKVYGTGPNQVPYRGVVGIAIYCVSRYDRQCQNNSITNGFHYGSPRPYAFFGPEMCWTVDNVSGEACGYTDYTQVDIMGVDVADPYNATRMKALIEMFPNSRTSNVSNIVLTQTAAIDAVTLDCGNLFGIFGSTVGNPDLTNVPNPNTLGPVSLRGGIIGLHQSRYETIPIGPVAYGSLGSELVHVAGTIYLSELIIEQNIDLTRIAVLSGATTGTDKIILALYNHAGVLVAHSDLAGTLSANANDFQEISLTAVYSAIGPRRYFLALQTNGTTDKTRRIAANTYFRVTKATAGSFGTLGTQTPGGSFVADAGPIGYVF